VPNGFSMITRAKGGAAPAGFGVPGGWRLGRQVGMAEAADHRRERGGRRRQVEDAVAGQSQAALDLGQTLLQRHERGGIFVLPLVIEDVARERGPELGVDRPAARELTAGRAHLLAERFVADGAAREADDGEARRQQAIARQAVERGQQLAVRRSPDAPKMTIAAGSGTRSSASPSRSGLGSTAEADVASGGWCIGLRGR
jgi:hypothetical protein